MMENNLPHVSLDTEPSRGSKIANVVVDKKIFLLKWCSEIDGKCSQQHKHANLGVYAGQVGSLRLAEALCVGE